MEILVFVYCLKGRIDWELDQWVEAETLREKELPELLKERFPPLAVNYALHFKYL